jgi:hypothetical protein
MAEESLTVIGIEEGSSVDFADMRNQFILKRCAERVVAWRQSTPDELLCGKYLYIYITLTVLMQWSRVLMVVAT